MMDTLDVFKQQAAQLTEGQRVSLIQFLHEQNRKDAQAKSSAEAPVNGASHRPNLSRVSENKWLTENWSAYLNQYVCLEGDQLISAGDNHHQVYDQAIAAGIKAPFMVRVQNPNLAYLDGFVAI